MCLETIIERSTTVKKSGVGWKIYVETLSGIEGTLQGNSKKLFEGTWLHERDYRGYRSFGQKFLRSYFSGTCRCSLMYPFGWHIYVSKKAALNRCRQPLPREVVKKVRYRQARTLGRQDGALVVVAKELFIV